MESGSKEPGPAWDPASTEAMTSALSDELAGDVGTDDIASAPTAPTTFAASASVLRSTASRRCTKPACRFRSARYSAA